jgi:uncharacterized protein
VTQELVLEAVFWSAVQRGMRLSTRDYQDALQALRLGYGLHRRERLLWLCQTLWARTEEEVRVLDLLFREMEAPTAAEIAEQLLEQAPGQHDGPGDTDEGASQQTVDTGLDQGSEDLSAPDYQFVPPTQGGLGLPRAKIADSSRESFILTPQPIIPLRSLIIAWRRFRAPLRTGPKVELDLEGTIAERCRQGLLAAPVLAPARRNQARLTVLVDVSSSMHPWDHFLRLLVASLAESQLGQASVYYFDNLPEQELFRRATLHDPVSLETLLTSPLNSALLIVSDGGAARGRRPRERARATADFLRRAGRLWRPIAWINPMPASRWPGTAADRIRQLPQVAMFDLSEDHLIDAIDVLRGQRSR